MNELDSDCVAELAHYNGINEEAMEEELQMVCAYVYSVCK